MPGVGVPIEELRCLKRSFVTLAFEFGELRPPFKGIFIGGIQIQQGLLERL